jgi:hypothetical protein
VPIGRQTGGGGRLFQAAVVVMMAQAGCVDVNGGAVELSWSIRTLDGQPSDCASHGLEAIQLEGVCLADDQGEPCVQERLWSWPCLRYRGSTRFVVPPGRWRFGIRALCEEGQARDVADARVPDPIVRDVELGEVVQLNALLIEIDRGCEPALTN